ncbi:MAG TPA: class A beta-lactamase [Desulfovibrio sp.]|nr:class A beta-lactamase [Desulfovibrio sp.]HZF62523.1 class A beta-lactamase [Desulfovibrio sp.]
MQKKLAELEASSGGRLGAAARVSNGGKVLSYRGNERFPMCSTFKVLAASAVLRDKPDILEQRIHFAKSDIQPWSPVTEKHLENGMTVAELCAAMLQHSDNTAANLVLAQLGGPEGLTSIARSFGDTTFRLDRWEVELNSAIPGDARDTTTPLAMCRTLNDLLCGNLLKAQARTQMTDWMLGCATGAGRIPVGAPQGWRSAHKSGSGENGTANDVGVLLPPSNPEQAAKTRNGKNKPLVVALYLTGSRLTGPENDKILAQATRLVCAAEGLATPLDNMY